MQLIPYVQNYNYTICFYGYVTLSPILVSCVPIKRFKMQFNSSRKIITLFLYMKSHFYKMCFILLDLSLLKLIQTILLTQFLYYF